MLKFTLFGNVKLMAVKESGTHNFLYTVKRWRFSYSTRTRKHIW